MHIRTLPLLAAGWLVLVAGARMGDAKDPVKILDVQPRSITADRSVKYDFDIVYGRAPRPGQ